MISRELVKKKIEEQSKHEANNKNIPGDNVVVPKQTKMLEDIKDKSQEKKTGGCC